MIGSTISHYKILEELGRGGMGVVYKAEDTRLKRIVALKFLPPLLTATEADRDRFQLEAQAAATLNHPNICTIHAIGDHGGSQFIDMEYVDGATLRKKLPIGNVAEAVSYAVQIGEALQEAHSKGIVHRDIKADNIMISSKNQIKVMDFGLAKLKGSLKLTKASSTVGTLAYMAPEQIQGGEVDARSDIFSFGVLLFEMLTGILPFRGEHEAAIMYSILNEEPEELQKFLPEVEPELLHIIHRALEKNPDDRYQLVQEMTIDLRRLKKESSRVSRRSVMDIHKPVEAAPSQAQQAQPSTTQKTTSLTVKLPRIEKRSMLWIGISLAVAVAAIWGYLSFLAPTTETGERIPIAVSDFLNETKEEELDGLSGMLITSLEQSRRLSVLTRSRMFDILKQMGKGEVTRIDESLGREICRRSGVKALVVASIRKFDQLYTIDLKVLDPARNEYLFTVKEEAEEKSNIPGMIDKLSEKTRIGLKENSSEVQANKQNVADIITPNIEAYQYYFRGEDLINKLRFLEAAEEFQKAVDVDSTFALAHYRRAYALSWQGSPGAEESIGKAMHYVERIPERERFFVRGEDAIIQKDVSLALSIYKEILTLYPDDKEANYLVGDYSFHQLDFPTAVTTLEKVIVMDRTFSRAHQHLGWTFMFMKNFDEMRRVAYRYVENVPSPSAHLLLAESYVQQALFDSALLACERGLDAFPNDGRLIQFRGQVRLITHDFPKAETEFTALTAAANPDEKRQMGYDGLVTLALYRGQYREALRVTEALIDLWSTTKNRTRLAETFANRARMRQEFLRDSIGAKTELQRAFEHEEAADQDFFIGLYHYYLAAGDLGRAREIAASELKVINAAGDRIVAAHAEYRAGNYGSAITILNESGFSHEELYLLAKCYAATGQSDQALGTLENLRRFYGTLFSFVWTRAQVDARSYYLAGTIYEATGDTKKAAQNYQAFLNLWKDADRDIPELRDAEQRLSALRARASR